MTEDNPNPPEFEQGRESFRAGIPLVRNPYRANPSLSPLSISSSRDLLWEWGWTYERDQQNKL